MRKPIYLKLKQIGFLHHRYNYCCVTTSFKRATFIPLLSCPSMLLHSFSVPPSPDAVCTEQSNCEGAQQNHTSWCWHDTEKHWIAAVCAPAVKRWSRRIRWKDQVSLQIHVHGKTIGIGPVTTRDDKRSVSSTRHVDISFSMSCA